MLYNRDFTKLTKEEIEAIDKAESILNREGDHFLVNAKTMSMYHDLLPDVAYYNRSIFPNNYLYTGNLEKKIALKSTLEEFKKLLDSNITERDILNYINRNQHYYIIGGLFQAYDFGHHEAFLFKEFELTSTFVADYLLVGKNSGGYNFIFIELENPYSNITLKNGELGNTFRKGIKQAEDWNSWIESNFNALRLIFDKFKKQNINLPKEFTQLDKSRINYAVVAGRRSDFIDKTYEIKRRMRNANNITIFHYDNLVDYFKELIRIGNY